MKLGLLTSSRADFGIYMPLIQKIIKDEFFHLSVIAFGAHTAHANSPSMEEIQKAHIKNIYKIPCLLSNDEPIGIASSYALTACKFADFWSNNLFDYVLCLGDRFEMNAAIQAGIPYGVKFAHLHGGETTLGAIDNIYRHQITLASKIHFVATPHHAKRVNDIIGTNNTNNVYTVGALSLDEFEHIPLLSNIEFRSVYNLPLEEEYILITFHPETVAPEQNELFAHEVYHALSALAKNYFLVISMPNADTLGSLYRESLTRLKSTMPNKVHLSETFGKINYFSAMKHATIVLGNSSSGIIEAASLKKYVVNVGDRQKGRDQSSNVINCPFAKDDIIQSVVQAIKLGAYNGTNIYYAPGTANQIINIMKKNNFQ